MHFFHFFHPQIEKGHSDFPPSHVNMYKTQGSGSQIIKIWVGKVNFADLLLNRKIQPTKK